MSSTENLRFVDPQAELRARYIKAMKAHAKARAAMLAAGVREWDLARYAHFDFAPFVALTCGAKGKRTGKPCPLTGIYDNGRCRFHGGLSTGPRTPEGKARAARNGRAAMAR